jgi:signal transduction histidine kinase
MIVHLVSPDPELHNLCREIIAEMPECTGKWTLSASQDIDSAIRIKEADLKIWDFYRNFTIGDRFRGVNGARHVFLVDRNDLAMFEECTATAEAHILLKPLTRASLATFLISAASRGSEKCLRADRDEVFQCLIQTNLKLQEYDHDRTTFLARAVHDFRAPLTAISGYCGLLLNEPIGDLNETQREVIRRMHNSAKRLSRMANAMFELSVGRQIRRTPELQTGDIRECIDQALHETAPFADEKAISISTDIEACDSELYFESGRIVQVLVNILDNACKFTPRNGSIEIRGYPFFWERRRAEAQAQLPAERRRAADYAPNSYRVDISDSGAPIPGDHLRRIFEEYTSYGGPRDRSGGGLGLAICKLIVMQHEGCIYVENKDSGPVFSFLLPISRTYRDRQDINEGRLRVEVTEDKQHACR